MNGNEYQRLAAKTLRDAPEEPIPPIDLVLAATVLYRNGKWGQLMELVKKHTFHRHPELVSQMEGLTRELNSPSPVGKDPKLNVEALYDSEVMLLWNLSGLVGESGEITLGLLDALRRQQPVDPASVGEELGDLLWYIAGLATQLGLSLDDIMEGNIAKLQRRYPKGFTSADSIARVDREVGDA